MKAEDTKKLEENFALVEATVELIGIDFGKLSKGVVKAGRRMRKNFLTLMKLSKASRAIILEDQKSSEGKSKGE